MLNGACLQSEQFDLCVYVYIRFQIDNMEISLEAFKLQIIFNALRMKFGQTQTDRPTDHNTQVKNSEMKKKTKKFNKIKNLTK